MSFKRWSIYRASLDPVIGSEQGKSRPVVIISDDNINDLLSIVNVLPITTRKDGRLIYPNETFIEPENSGLPKESIVLCYQIRTLDKKRLSTPLGEIKSEEKKKEILNALCFQLGIDNHMERHL